MHDDIAANHPGPVNALDPDFSKRNDAGLALALTRADKVKGFAGYYYALKAYAAMATLSTPSRWWPNRS